MMGAHDGVFNQPLWIQMHQHLHIAVFAYIDNAKKPAENLTEFESTISDSTINEFSTAWGTPSQVIVRQHMAKKALMLYKNAKIFPFVSGRCIPIASPIWFSDLDIPHSIFETGGRLGFRVELGGVIELERDCKPRADCTISEEKKARIRQVIPGWERKFFRFLPDWYILTLSDVLIISAFDFGPFYEMETILEYYPWFPCESWIGLALCLSRVGFLDECVMKSAQGQRMTTYTVFAKGNSESPVTWTQPHQMCRIEQARYVPGRRKREMVTESLLLNWPKVLEGAHTLKSTGRQPYLAFIRKVEFPTDYWTSACPWEDGAGALSSQLKPTESTGVKSKRTLAGMSEEGVLTQYDRGFIPRKKRANLSRWLNLRPAEGLDVDVPKSAGLSQREKKNLTKEKDRVRWLAKKAEQFDCSDSST